MALDVEGVSKRFGGLQAVDAVSFVAPGGMVTAVIGPNGAGKSTLLDCLSGITEWDTGRVALDGIAIGPHLAGDLVRLGITRTFQNLRLFESLTVEQHVLLALRSVKRSSRARVVDGASDPSTCRNLLERVGLAGKATTYPRELAYGEKRRLEIARGLATAPRVFLLDEPAAGSTPAEQNALAALIGEVARQGTAVILVEHHMDLVARLASSVVVLNFGKVIVRGPMGEIRRHPEVISAYLGTTAKVSP
jgi:ABC-type branched-subunit amino acid transport system ATPase component